MVDSDTPTYHLLPPTQTHHSGLSTMDPTHHLPLQILRSDPTPSAPNRSDPPGSAIDWLPDFLELSWVSYGASSLLVISHFPSPLSENETVIGPIFRQVFELSGDPSSAVRAVAWSPVMPSLGEVAAAAENCVWVFSHDSASSKGSFCWSQNAVLVNSAKVDAIGWTGSGDGIIASGVEVVLWKRSGRSWEIAWKFKPDQPQSLVSATWSVEGPFATAAYQSKWLIEGLLTKEASKCVLVSQRDGKSEFVKSELQHPLPVSMIQWRPLTGKPLSRDAKHPSRHVLLTSCLDGTVRLWCEVDDGRARKVAKDINDHKTTRWSFSVAAVIEINQALNGILGIDIYVSWAIETGGLNKASAGAKKLFSANGYEHDQLGNCEWLIGFGPGMLVKFWALHCLDDVSPVRFPRVTLWKTQELQVLEGGHVHRTGLSNYNDRIPLNKVVILRNCMSGPPVVCSLIQLLPCNSLVWSLLYTQSSNNVEDLTLNKPGMENTLSCSADGILNLDGHAGRILQVAVHPYSCEVELAVSLDSDGLLLFWFFSTISNYILGCPTLVPTWDICGKLATQSSSSRYTSVRWAPAILNEVAVLLMGHAGGIDCFIVKIHQDEEEIIECHYLCTIPFTGHGPYEDGPNSISTIPLPPTCHKTLRCSKFMLLGVWMNGFQALSWEITLHTFDLSGSYCDCDFETGNGPESMWGFEGTFTNVRYCLKVNACSSQIPDPYIHDEVTSFAVVCQGSLMRIEKNLGPTIDQCSSCPAYLMATGCSDGSLKLWRSRIAKLSTPNIPWELVGMFVAHKGPISTVCLSECGRKIATICKDFSSNTVGTLQIWDPTHLAGAGSFVLEDTISFDQELVALNWLPLGNGQLLLGVCMLNQFRVYSLERCGGQTLLNPEKSVKKNIWVCIASTHTFPPICDFFWGPRATAVFVHKSYFCVNSQWLFLVDKKHLANGQSNDIAENCMDSAGGMKEDTSSIFFDCELQQFDKTLLDESRRDCKSGTPFKTDLKKDYLLSSLFVARSQLDCAWGTKRGLWTMLEVVENLSGSLPVYHPEALFMNIYSGNWKRAYIALRHLNDFLSSESSSGSKHYPSKSSIFVPQILLSTFLDGIISIDSNDKGFQWSGDAVTSSSQLQRDSSQFTYDSYASNNLFSSSSTKYGLVDFVEHLEKLYELAAITNIERMQILAIFDLLNEMTNSNSGSAYESLDEPGRRFWIALRFQQLHFFRKFGRSVSVEELVVDSKLIGWAYHSDCQENLFGSFLPNEPSWQEMRNLGVGFWFTNTAQLRSRMEKLARLQYLKRRDPKDCALLYIALNRIQVLTGLFKISKDEKDKPLVAFLSRNFQEEKNKSAALKNAYVLMGRHQLELAVAFFLLGGDTSSAVSICAKNLGDEQLAVVICRLTEGRGGPLERHLISKSLLPFAIERGDSWLASLLEWELGNYCQSFISMLGLQINSATEMYATLSSGVAFSDPNVGLYCLLLATKNSMRNAVGERNTAILSRWAVFMTATALKRCGLPLEALEYLSSPTTILGDTDLGTLSDIGDFEKLNGILNPSPKNSSNWLSSNVAFRVESLARLDLALQYLSTLVREHPSWADTVVAPSRAISHINECENHEHVKVLGSFHQKLYTALHHLEQKFSVVPFHLISMVLLSLYNRGLWFVGYEILHAYTSQDQDLNKSQIVRSLLYPLMHKQLLKATRETSLLFSHVIAACSITCSKLKSDCLENNVSGEGGSSSSNAWEYYFQGLILSLRSLRSALQIISVSSTEDLIMKPLIIIDWIEYYVQFACAWLQKNSKVLFLLMQPLLITFTNGHTPYEVDLMDLKKILPQIAESVTQNSLIDNVCTGLQGSQGTDVAHLIPEDERWQITGACLWQHISRLMKQKLGMLSYKLDEGCISGVPDGKHFSSVPCSENFGPDDNRTEEVLGLVSLSLVKLLKTTLAHVSSYHVMRLASHLQHKMDNGLHVMTLVWLEEYNQSQTRGLNQHLNQDMLKLETIGEKHGSDILWDICADPKIISESFTQEKINWSHSLDHKPSKGWNNIYRGVTTVDETEETHNHELTPKSTSANSEAGLPSRSLFRSGHSFLSGWQKDTTATKEVSPFLNPKEIYKRNGELLEALCLNSVNQKQAALASNRKGIIFFNWKDDMPDRDHSDYIWSEADWPLNGWAGSESTPAPTYVSPGVGLGIKKGTHVGLGGATVGVGSLARSARDLRGGGAFGNQGYPGMHVSGLGWETREDFEEVVDPPPTVENANTRVFSSHPSRPFFLVGSSNTHIYLWEFGKDKATATYGVLPAANVPPPYALASISALQFDHCGHRFATAALDGTVCTWQLEVGGRSNIRPTESSLCFNSHASDVAYVTSSGSIIAVAGYSSSSVNVVIWDTLAPPTTSRASIICHEGGARSLSVFDNDIGSGSISPLIVTGGKGGDVGLHDFRYIATGRSKRHRQTDKGEQAVKTSSNIDHHPADGNRFGEQNQNGMLWYIPKAHSGSVTKISTIPNTSLFLTGSKDGDVKLWDAKRAKLVYHWPKLHERHTFLQPSSRGFGGVVQAAVTDIKVVSQGFLTCGGDGTVKLVHLKDHQY